MRRHGWTIWVLAVTALAALLMAGSFLRGGTPVGLQEQLPPVRSSLAPDRDETELVNVNTAGLEELITLPGVGRVRGQAIIDWREANGPFRYPEELIYVSGIGETTLAGLMDYITVGGQN